MGEGFNYECKICSNALSHFPNLEYFSVKLAHREKYLTTENIGLGFGYYQTEIENLLPNFSKRLKSTSTKHSLDESVKKHLSDEFNKEKVKFIQQPSQRLIPEHISPILHNDFKTALLNNILFCPDERLQSYKGKSIHEHINSKNLPATEQSKLVEYLRKFVDTNLTNIRHNLDLIRTTEKTNFDTTIGEQGSGVKSLICLMTDILSETETKLLLIDEPELGLNPLGRHELFKFLLNQCKEKQIFIATHDPTFVNPILWERNNVSIYLYSLISKGFVKVDLAKTKQDPNSFAGFLPHTTSLKKIHIYVEGTSDVYTFQVFLNAYLKRFRKRYKIQNKIGLFHLAGSFWSHLLHTIPKSPFISLIVLDGDKCEEAKRIIKKYSEVEENRFQFFETLEDLGKLTRKKRSNKESPCPVYCLQRSKLEDYLKPHTKSKEKCPAVAYNMKSIPKEIEWLFDIIFGWTGMRTMRQRKVGS